MDIIQLPPRKNATDNDYIKWALLKYGALDVSYHAAQVYPYFNQKTSAQYCNVTAQPNHGVTLVGWDDSYSADNFMITPPGDGAWIFKNSWGEENGIGGYYYISYYDMTFSMDRGPYAYVLFNTEQYNKNYQYNIQGDPMIQNQSTEYRNYFVAVDDDLIAAVGTGFNDANVEYSIEIYVNDELKLEQNGVSTFSGVHTIPLDSYIPIKEGDDFCVKIKSNAVPFAMSSRQHFMKGVSEFYYNGTWNDAAVYNCTCYIKAFTVEDTSSIIDNSNITVDYAGGSFFRVKVVTDNGHAVGAGESVKFTINGKTTTVKTDDEGIAKIKINEVPKKYTVTTKVNGKTYKNTVTVKQVLTASKVTVKKTAKKFTLKAKLKINGKLQKGKVIKFKFNGKTYKVKTNSKGIAQKTLKKSVIKKLKKGKTYTAKVTYLKDTIKTTVKVKG